MATRSARTVDKTINDKHARILKVLLHKPENKFCVDCRRKGIPTILNCSDVSFSLILEEMSWFSNGWLTALCSFFSFYLYPPTKPRSSMGKVETITEPAVIARNMTFELECCQNATLLFFVFVCRKPVPELTHFFLVRSHPPHQLQSRMFHVYPVLRRPPLHGNTYQQRYRIPSTLLYCDAYFVK